MRRCVRLLVASLIVFSLCTACQRSPGRRPDDRPHTAEAERLLNAYSPDRQMQDIKTLVAPNMEGRAAGTPGEDKAGYYLIRQMQELGLHPWTVAGLEDFRQCFHVRRRGLSAENIIGVLPGSMQDRYLIVSAHYDHLGTKNGTMFRGADDNAAGVAAALELARAIRESGSTPGRSIVFAFLSGEETGLDGSKFLADRMVRFGLHKHAAVVNLDMLGGTGGEFVDVWKERADPDTDALAALALQEAHVAGVPARLIRRRFGPVDSRSFARKGMPAITISWHLERPNHPYRHTPQDTVQNLQPELLVQATRAAIRIAWAVASS